MNAGAAPAQGFEPCRVCGAPSRFVFAQRVLQHEGVRYFDCTDCGYLQTERPFWLAQAYARAINDVDTGILVRNQLNLRRVIMTLTAFGCLSGRVVDHAGGFGILVRLLRDAGVDAYWRDKYCPNLVARGFEADAAPGGHDLLTAFEVLEHLEAPLVDLEQMLQTAPLVLVSTELVPPGTAASPDWWYLGPEHGQHIGFFRRSTLARMAERLGCHHATDGHSLHLFARVPIPRRWRLLQRLHRLAPSIARRRLRPRTWADFERLRAAER